MSSAFSEKSARWGFSLRGAGRAELRVSSLQEALPL